MSRQEKRWAVAVSVFVLLALGFAGREDYQAQLALDQAPVMVVQR